MERIINFSEDSDAYYDAMSVVARKLEDRWGPIITREMYIHRDPNFHFSDGFEAALREQVEMMADLRMTPEEFEWKRLHQPWLPLSYLQWKRDTFRFNPSHVKFNVVEGKLKLMIEGPASSVCHWETPLLSMISRLRFTIILNGEKIKPDAENHPAFEDQSGRKRRSCSAASSQCLIHRHQMWETFNDVSHPAMQHVIKAVAFMFYDGRWIDVCKLSDVSGKNSGSDECIAHTRWDVGLA